MRNRVFFFRGETTRRSIELLVTKAIHPYADRIVCFFPPVSNQNADIVMSRRLIGFLGAATVCLSLAILFRSIPIMIHHPCLRIAPKLMETSTDSHQHLSAKNALMHEKNIVSLTSFFFQIKLRVPQSSACP